MHPSAVVAPSIGRSGQYSKSAAHVLEVRQRWGDLVLDVRHVAASAGKVTLGARIGWRWEVLGVDMGPVGERARWILPWLLPLGSEVRPAPLDDFLAEGDLSMGHELFRRVDDAWWVQLEAGMTVRLRDDAGEHDLEGLLADGRAVLDGAGHRLRLDGAVEIRVGALTFEAREVPRPRAVERAVTELEPGLLASLSFLGACALLFGVVVATSPPPPEVSVQDIPDRFLELAVQLPPEPEVKPEVKPEPETVAAAPDPRRHREAPRTHGRRGDRRPSGERSLHDVATAHQAGLLGSGLLEQLSGGVDLGVADRIGSVIGSRGPSTGLGGRRVGPGGLGGGGVAEGIAVGRVGGDGVHGDGLGGDGLWGKRSGALTPEIGDIVTLGALPPSAVDEVVRSHLRALRYCYQRELPKDPSLQGNVSVRFVIAADGRVSTSSIKTSTLGNAAVEGCLTTQFLRMKFPEPRGNGIVIVSYPLVFAPAQ